MHYVMSVLCRNGVRLPSIYTVQKRNRYSSSKTSLGMCDALDARVSDIGLGLSVVRFIWDELRERAILGVQAEMDDILFDNVAVIMPFSSNIRAVGVGDDERE